MEELYKHAREMLNWLDLPAGRKYQDFLTVELARVQVALAKSNEPNVIFRLQGELTQLHFLVGLQSLLRTYLKNKGEQK